jgi:signal transduction histidine kinase
MRADAEVERLNALERYRILDTARDPTFDDLTVLASHICGTPISTVTLIASDRQWFKSKVGLDNDETSRSVSFCAHAIEQDGLFVVSDASQDERFATNPLVTADPHIRFYAGAPLVTPEGHALGTLCVIDRVPRELTDEQLRALDTLSRAAMAHLELHRQNEELREIDRLKDEFVAVLSHELRTPVTSINGYVELLLGGDPGPLTETQERFVRIVGRNNTRLLGLIEEMLLLAEAEAGELALRREPMDLRLIVSEAIESAKPRAEAKNIELSEETNGPVMVDGDRSRLAEIADNLISNAVKYTPESGRVVARVHSYDDEARVEVSDTGMGIAAEELPHLFGRFYRTKAARDAAIPGTGLGLAITRALVASHGGVIEVSSQPGAGTTFRVRLPALPLRRRTA